MFTVNIKGFRNPNNLEFIKLYLIFYRSSYPRASKVIGITGLFKDWKPKSQSFIENSPENIDKNKLLRKEQLKYLKVAERWESDGKKWIPRELSHFYKNRDIERNNYRTVYDIFDCMILKYTSQERFKNGKVLYSLNTARYCRYVKNSLVKFTKSKYHREFSKYQFRDITNRFLLDYVLYQKKCGDKNGNRGGIRGKLKFFYSTFLEAKRCGVFNVDLSVFGCVRTHLKSSNYIPKSVSHKIIQQIKVVDRAILDEREVFYLDLFLFSYYAGGMSPIDVCLLEYDRIKDGMIVYERTKSNKVAKVIVIDKAEELIEKYRNYRFQNYAFPVITKKDTTQAKIYGRARRVSTAVNMVLKKICCELGINEHVLWSSARGSYISKMIDEGYHPLQIAQQTGNSPSTIYRHYYAITDREEFRDKMNKIF